MERKASLKSTEELRVRRRKLPHWELPGSVYFITFTTADGFTLSAEAKDIVFKSIRFHAGKKYELHGCVVMETHAHILLKPLEVQARTPVLPAPREYGLTDIMHSIKSYSAHRIRKLEKTAGSIWLEESYDRVIRNEKEYTETLNYIHNNPVKAGLAEKPEDYRWLYFEGSAQAGTPVPPTPVHPHPTFPLKGKENLLNSSEQITVFVRFAQNGHAKRDEGNTQVR